MTQRSAHIAAVLLMLAASLPQLAPACLAQGAPRGAPGAEAPRMRITWRTGSAVQRVVGQVVFQDSGTVALWASAMQQYSIVADSITRIERSERRPRAARTGAAVGALSGAFIGTFMALVSHDSCEANPNCFNLVEGRGLDVVMGGAVWALLGGGVGALVGRGQRDVWRDTVLVVSGRPVPAR